MARKALFFLPLLFLHSEVGAVQMDDLGAAKLAMQDQEWSDAAKHLTKRIDEGGASLEAHYLRGISFAERGKFRTLQTRLANTLGAAEEDFEYVLRHDSLHNDVLFRYGLLRRYSGDLRSAIELAEAQVRLKPELAHARVGLHQFYWRYIVQTEPEEARRWLRDQPWPLAQLFLGETYARQSFFQTAEEIFADLQESPHVRVPALLALARLYFQRQDPERGSAAMHEAIASVSSVADALLLFDNIKTIVSPAERAEFERIKDLDSYRAFFEVFWTKRDPMPAAPYNARAAEHFRRLRLAESHYLFHGYRTWYRSPFTADASLFPPTYALGSEFDDRGIVFLRHGEPDDYTIGEAQSWLYQDSLMVFHFAPTCVRAICSVSRHFVPIPRGPTWSSKLVGRDALEAERKSAVYLTAGLTTDRHRWPERTKVLDIPHVAASFRGRDGRTLVEVYYRVPVDELGPALGAEADTVHVETGMTVHDVAWQRMGMYRQTKRLAGPYVGRFQADLPQEAFHFALHVRSLQTQHVGAHRFDYLPRSFEGAGLKLSDILLADSVLDLSDGPGRARDDVLLHVNPSAEFLTSDPVFVYFEIYDLARHQAGGGRYSVSYSIRSLRDEEDAVTLSAEEQLASERSAVEYVAIDVTDVPAGSYELVVTVRDAVSGAEAEQSRSLELRRRR